MESLLNKTAMESVFSSSAMEPILNNSAPSSIILPSNKSLSSIRCTAPNVKNLRNRGNVATNYDRFIFNITQKQIQSVNITQDQRNADYITLNGESFKLILPEGYDYINYLIENDISVDVKESFRITHYDTFFIIAQFVLLKIIYNQYQSNKKIKSSNATNNLATNDINATNDLVARLLQNSTTIDNLETIITILYSLVESDHNKDQIMAFINSYYRKTRVLLRKKKREIVNNLGFLKNKTS